MPGTTDLPLLGADQRPPAVLPDDRPVSPIDGRIYATNIQHISVNAKLGREQMFELGRKGPYQRYVNFPVELDTAIRLLPAASG